MRPTLLLHASISVSLRGCDVNLMSPVDIKVSFCALLLSFGQAGSAFPARAEWALPHWSVMTDARGTRVDYPAGIFTIDEGTPPRGMGRVLDSAWNGISFRC